MRVFALTGRHTSPVHTDDLIDPLFILRQLYIQHGLPITTSALGAAHLKKQGARSPPVFAFVFVDNADSIPQSIRGIYLPSKVYIQNEDVICPKSHEMGYDLCNV